MRHSTRSVTRRADVTAFAMLFCAMSTQSVAGVVPVIPDANRDGIVNAVDVAAIGQCLLQHPRNADCINADVDGDGDVDVTDLQIVIRFMRTRQPKVTGTPTPVQTPPPVTATATATDTPIAPTATNAPPPTATLLPTALPTDTATRTRTPTASSTAAQPASATATDTSTPIPTATVTQTASPSFTSTGTPPGTFTPTQTATRTGTQTNTPLPTLTPVPTLTDTPTSTPANTAIDTSTPTPTSTIDAGLPPDPETVAPPVDQSVVTTLQTATEFLYTGANPIQTGVAPGTIDARRVAVLRGKVMDRSNAPLPGVQITILDHPEFGQTLSRADGLFDLAVNGGGILTVRYDKAGLLPAQRQINAPWRDYAMLPDVVLIGLDAQMTVINTAASTPVQVARGSVVTDADGTRQATVLFPQGTTATMVLPDGTGQPLTTLSVRATEYTVGANGPFAMPAELPPTSGYTYAVELSVDEAMAAGAAEVRFSSPLPFYVENFLNFPVGTTVPLGNYDRVRGFWVPGNSGTVIKILSVTGGSADLDLDGDGLADGASALAAFAITDAERQQLALLYSPGQSLWRVLIPHFSTADCNWPYGAPPDAVLPGADPAPDEALDESCIQSGSIIECQSQILGEFVAVPGTPFRLHYQGDRVPGRKVANSLEIPLSGAQLPASLLRIDLEIEVAGRMLRQSFAPLTNLRTTFIWDGRDAYGRMLQGVQPVTVGIGYTYRGVYGPTARFGGFPTATFSGSLARQELTLWRTWVAGLGSWDARAAGLGGWTLSPHHTYDTSAQAQVLRRGDGLRQSGAALGPVISTFAGRTFSSFGCFSGDGFPATQAAVCPYGLATAADGSVYITMGIEPAVRRVGPNGIITRVAGGGTACTTSTAPCGDGGLATQAQLNNPRGIAVGPDNSFFIADLGINRIRKVNPGGIISTVAGTGVAGFAGDGGPAQLAQLNGPSTVAVGPDGSIYIADAGNLRIRRVGTDGIITTVIGTGTACSSATGPCGDGGPAPLAQLNFPLSVAVGTDGSIYVAAGQRVRRVAPDGIITTIAGNGAGCSTGPCGDGGPATQAPLDPLNAIAVAPDDTIYVTHDNFRVRRMRLGGTINTVAGPLRGSTGDGGLAQQARLNGVVGLAVGPDGSIYVSENGFNQERVRRITPVAAMGWTGGVIVPAADGSEVFLFDPSGRHLRTVDAITASLREEFTYDGSGKLTAITDADGNVTIIERDGSGAPTGIVGPFGQRTLLSTNADGYLERITSPTGESTQLIYTADGLLTDLTNPRGYVTHYDYDALGRLISATDPPNATKTLARVGTNLDYTVTFTSPLGRATTYHVERLGTGNIRLTNTSAATGQVQVVLGKDGNQSATFADGTIINLVLGPDPRWGMQAPVVTSMTLTTPGGRTYTRTAQRSVTLANANDLLSLTAYTETTAVNGLVDTVSYGGTTRTITHTSASGRRDAIVIDARGRPMQGQYGDISPSTFTYDSRGRLDTITWGAGAGARITQLGYDPTGYLASVVDALNRTTTYSNDAGGRVTQQSLGGAVTGFDYDTNGNLTALTPPGQPDHGFSYTERDDAALYSPPAVGAEVSQVAFLYDEDGAPVHVDRPAGNTIDFSYDTAGRLLRLDSPSSFRQYGYDTAGRLTSASTSSGISLAYTYDATLPISTTWSGAVAGNVSRSFDNNLQVTSQSVNGSNPIAMQYDADGLTAQAGALTITRNAQTGLVTATTLGSVSDATTYDGFAEVASYTASAGSSAVYAVAYGRDALGRITSKNETINGVTRGFVYAYDAAGRLSEVRQDGVLVATYDYDGNGNRLSFTGPGGTVAGAYDAQDRLMQYGVTTYAHSVAGDLQSQTTGGTTTAYRYDGLSNLTGVTLPDGTQIDYLLDGQARRVGKMIDGTLVQGFLYQDQLRPIAELDGGGSIVSRFVYAGPGNVPAYMIRGGVAYRIIADQVGSPRLVIDTASGTVAQQLDYDAFGNVLLDTNPGFQPFGFAGGIYDQDTKLMRFGARDYDADTGRWTTKDPIGFRGNDANLYGYVLNDPINRSDITGMIPPPPLGSPLWNPVIGALTRMGYSAEAAPIVAQRLAARFGFEGLRLAVRTGGLSRLLGALGPEAGFVSLPVAACIVSFAIGYEIGSALDESLGLSDKLSDGLLKLTEPIDLDNVRYWARLQARARHRR